MENMDNHVKETVCDFGNLYRAMRICKRNVMWKDSVAGFVKNGLANCANLADEHEKGTYRISKYSTFKVYEPKERDIVSTRIKDRVFQRSLCDNYLTKEISKSFIYDNCACQVNKGTDFARERLKCHLQKFYREHGTDGYVLKCDLKNYFGSTSHEVAYEAVRKRVSDEWALREVKRIIDSFDQGEDPNVGMGLGSQVTQLIQLAVLDDLDHYIKEQLRIKHYVRYMDDFILIHENKEYLKYCKTKIQEKIEALGLALSQKKTQLFPVTQPIPFLGFTFRLTETGKVVVKMMPDKVAHERRKLKRLVGLAKAGVLTRADVDACFTSWKAHASKGDTYYLIQNMERFYLSLWEEDDNVQARIRTGSYCKAT